MKKVLALTLAMLLCASMLAGCGKSEEEQQTEQQTTEQESADNTNGIGMTSEDCKGKVLAWNVGMDSASFDPANSISADSKSVINNTLEGLMRNTGEGAAPAMAQQMPEEKVNEDGTVTLTYTLREATWSDGQPVTAGDFAFAWKRCADPANQMSNAYLMSVLANYDDIAAGLADIEELGVKAVDDTTLEVTLKQPTAYFNELLCLPAFMPLREDVAGNDSSWSKDPQRAVANGPFVFAGYTEGKELILKKNGLPQELNVHSLRHTAASLMIAGGTDVATVAGILGHSQPSTTLDIYTHAFDKNKKAASAELQGMLEI